MKIIAFLGQKGGSEKTTLAVHMAVAAQEAGEQVVVIDTDPQKSATVWGDSRASKAPIVVAVSATEIPQVLSAARADKMTLAIIDTAPHAAQVARNAGLIVIPCRPTAFDLAAVESTVAIVQAAQLPTVFALSACPPRTPEIAETREVLKSYDLPICGVEIGDRRAFARAVATGRAVTEFEEDGKAAAEVGALWGFLKEEV